jgi:hypothetical protein
MIIADATAHCFNWAEDNVRVPEAEAIRMGAWGFHHFLTPHKEFMLERSEYLHDWQSDETADALFYEVGVDMIAYHGTPIYDFFKDGHSATFKGLDMREKHPTRTIVYGAINPYVFDSAAEIRDEVDRLADAGITGLKIYAARYVDGVTYEHRLDDKALAFPMIERALERGIRTIATHKAVPQGPVPSAPYGVGDVPGAAALYPEMNFEIVHSGMAFLEDTAFLAAAFDNVYFNLETSFLLVDAAPRRFAELLGALLAMGAEDRILFATGFALNHPRAAIEAFLDFEMPEDLVRDYGRPALTEEAKRKILGQNLLRLHGIDEAEFRRSIAGDEVSQRQSRGLEAPWSNLRADKPVTV